MYLIKNLNFRAAFLAGSAGLFQLDCTHIDATPKKVFHLPVVVPECLPNYPKGFTNKNYKHVMQGIFERVEELIDGYIKKTNTPGLSCSVAINDGLPMTLNYGVSDKENDVPMHMETKIRIGTISMPITAMFVLQLAQNNFINLDDNLRNIGKSFWNNYVARTSLQQLLTHKSGISDLLESDVNDFDDHNDVPLQQLVYYLLCGAQNTETLEDKSLKRWNDYKFSRLNYLFLAIVVSQALAKKLKVADAFNELFRSYGLLSTCVDESREIISFRSKHYTTDKEGVVSRSPYVDPSRLLGVHGIMSTSYDMCSLGQRILMNSFGKNIYPSPSHQVVNKLVHPIEVEIVDGVEYMRCILGTTLEIDGMPTVYYNSNSIGCRCILYLHGITTDMKHEPKVSIAILTNLLNTEQSEDFYDDFYVDKDNEDLKNLAAEIANIIRNPFYDKVKEEENESSSETKE